MHFKLFLGLAVLCLAACNETGESQQRQPQSIVVNEVMTDSHEGSIKDETLGPWVAQGSHENCMPPVMSAADFVSFNENWDNVSRTAFAYAVGRARMDCQFGASQSIAGDYVQITAVTAKGTQEVIGLIIEDGGIGQTYLVCPTCWQDEGLRMRWLEETDSTLAGWARQKQDMAIFGPVENFVTSDLESVDLTQLEISHKEAVKTNPAGGCPDCTCEDVTISDADIVNYILHADQYSSSAFSYASSSGSCLMKGNVRLEGADYILSIQINSPPGDIHQISLYSESDDGSDRHFACLECVDLRDVPVPEQ